uniref:Uncharacterized protein LOC102810274 n=1 Tax=Saccoglossus kowalevskii TaxID=10224 RepID=A0ABM0MJ70_SACKO|nr:PREDICTED: uncharacterized protein LOC102810274 [Saccoglossus kowalevskii]
MPPDPLVRSRLRRKIDPKSWPFENPNKFGSVIAEPVEPKWLYKTPDGRQISVFDGMFKYKSVFALSMYNFLTGYWRYGTPLDPYNENLSNDTNAVPWKSHQDISKFAQSDMGRTIQQMVTRMSGSDKPYYLYQVTDNVVRRGDVTKYHHDATRDEKEISVVIYMNEIWKKNYYGETMFYDEDMEITAVVKPKFGRMVVWDSSVAYLFRPPSVGFKQGQHFLHLRLSTNVTKAIESESRWRESINEVEQATKTLFVKHKDNPVEKKIDVQKHLTHEFQSSAGKRIVVLDGLFNNDDLDSLRRYTLKYANYFYDDSLDLESDNVQWIAGYEVDDYIQSQDQWFPYDVSCNLIRSADHTRIHEDCEPHEDEWTFLIYLNPNWTENYYGETAYFERNSDDTEYIAEVLPSYGRAVIHEGIIPHSARPPSSLYTGARLSFAVKMSINERVGREKIILEKFRHEESLLRAMPILLKHFSEEGFEDYLQQRVVKVLKHEAKLQRELHADDGDDNDDDNDNNDDEREEEEEGEEDEFGFEDEEGDTSEFLHREAYLQQKKKECKNDIKKLRELTLEVAQYGGTLKDEYAAKFLPLF